MPTHLSLYNEEGLRESQEIILPGDYYGKRIAIDDNGEKKGLLIHCPAHDKTTDIYFVDGLAKPVLAFAEKAYELENGDSEAVLILGGKIGRMILVAEHDFLFSTS